MWLLVAPLVAWAVVRVFGLDHGFPLVPLMTFTPFALAAAFLLAGLALALRNWAATGVAALVTLALAAVVLPRAIGADTVDPAGREILTVVSANVYVGQGDPGAVVDLVDGYDADLLVIQELTPKFARKLRRAGIERRLPEAIAEVGQGPGGGGIYSRLPLRPIAPGLRSFFREPRAELRLPDGRRVRVADVHPLTPGRTGIDAWERSLEGLPATGSGVPWLLVGDFNATLDTSQLRSAIDHGYSDAGTVAGQGLEPTWPNADHALPPFVTIDHILLDRRLGVVSYGVDDLPGSDHRSIHAELALPEAGG